jgi:hypothetical protein
MQTLQEEQVGMGKLEDSIAFSSSFEKNKAKIHLASFLDKLLFAVKPHSIEQIATYFKLDLDNILSAEIADGEVVFVSPDAKKEVRLFTTDKYLLIMEEEREVEGQDFTFVHSYDSLRSMYVKKDFKVSPAENDLSTPLYLTHFVDDLENKSSLMYKGIKNFITRKDPGIIQHGMIRDELYGRSGYTIFYGCKSVFFPDGYSRLKEEDRAEFQRLFDEAEISLKKGGHPELAKHQLMLFLADNRRRLYSAE